MCRPCVLVPLFVIQLQVLCGFGFEAVSHTNQYHVDSDQGDRIDDEPMSRCSGGEVREQMCGRCSEFVHSVSVADCCQSSELWRQCVQVLGEVDRVEELLPSTLDTAPPTGQQGGGGLALLHRALARDMEGMMGRQGSQPQGMDLLLQAPEGYDSPSKRGGLSGKYNRVWWKGPSKRPNENKVFTNYNRIWWRKG